MWAGPLRPVVGTVFECHMPSLDLTGDPRSVSTAAIAWPSGAAPGLPGGVGYCCESALGHPEMAFL